MKNNEKLINLLKDVRESVDFYSEILVDEKEITEENVQEVFRKIPIVDKNIIKSNYDNFIDKSLKQYNLSEIFNLNRDFKKEYHYELGNTQIVAEYTSGSSGTPFVTFKTARERYVLGKNLWKLRNRISPATPEKFFYFAHTFDDSIYPFPFEEPSTEPKKIIKELEYLSHGEYSWWHSTAFILEYYYNYLLKNHHSFKGLKVIENSGSYISEEEREKFSNTFSCSIANYYGSREVWAMAYDCKEGHLHVNQENIKFELVDDEGNLITEPNKIGNVVVTSYCQRSMPFIRYRVGDIGYYMEEKCSCGNESDRVYILPGRHIIAGTKLYGNKFFKDIISYMILQFNKTKFHSISVQQVDYKEFVVNIKECMEDRSSMEEVFYTASKFVHPDKDYTYIFTYDEKKSPKSIFTINMKKQNQ